MPFKFNLQRYTSAADPVDASERPFIVAADVKGAFDSIPLPALERVVTALAGGGRQCGGDPRPCGSATKMR